MNRLLVCCSLAALVALSACPSGGPEGAPPATPTALYSAPSGISSSRTVFVRGIAESGSTVELYLEQTCGGPVVMSGSADQFGSAGFQLTVPENVKTGIAARAVRDGVKSACSYPVYYEHDGVPPGAPVLSLPQPVSTTQPLRVTVSGTTEANAKVSLFLEGACKGNSFGATASAQGAFSFEVDVPANALSTFSATATDPQGNTSGCSLSVAYQHDDTPPNAPVLTGLSPSSPSTNSTVKVTGSAEGLARVRLYKDAACTQPLGSPVNATGSGAFQIIVSVPQNQTTELRANATDEFNNVSVCSAPLSYTHDTLGPPPPSVGDVNPPSPSNSVTSFKVTVYAEGNSVVRVYGVEGCSGTPVFSGTMPPGGAGLVTLNVMPNTTRVFSVGAEDSLGNKSICSAPFTLAHDSNPPMAPVLTGTSPASPSTTDTSPDVQGTGEPGSTVEVFENAGCAGFSSASATVPSSGAFSVTVFVSSNATTTLSARATDAAGNVSPCSADLLYLHDNQAPTAPVLSGTEPPSPSKSSTTPVVRGLGEANQTVEAYTDATCAGAIAATATVGPIATGNSGLFSVTVPVPSSATTPIGVRIRDAAGLASPCVTLSYTHDPVKGWGNVATITAAPGDAYQPVVALTPSGATAVWARTGTTKAIEASDLTSGAWATPAALSTVSSDAVDRIRLVSDATGNVFATWSQYGSGSSFSVDTWVSRKPTGAGWDAPTTFGTDTQTPDIAVDGAGGAMAVYRYWTSTQYQIHARRFTPASGWATTGQRVDTNTYQKFAPRLGFVSNTEAVVLYTENRGTGTSPQDYLMGSRYTGTGFQTPAQRSTYRVRRGEYRMLQSSNGNGLATWLEVPSGSSYARPYANTWFAGTGFGTNTALMSFVSFSTEPKAIEAALNASGTALVVWPAGSAAVLNYARSAMGTWSSATQLYPQQSTLAKGNPVRVAQDANGNGVAAWVSDNLIGGYGLWVSRYTPTSGWEQPQLIDGSLAQYDEADVAMDLSRIVLVWQRTLPTGGSTLHSISLE